MAMFQQYQSGIQPVTGMAEAGANIGNMYAQGINTFTKGLAEGIKAYNENSAKNDLANQKLQMLSQDVANKIAMYSQDPEIAQSGVLQGLMQTAATLQDAPTKGLNQRLGIVHEAETRLAGFGQQLQEWSFLRGRQMERDMSAARGGVREFDEQTVPTAIIPSGKMPYLYSKTYAENEAELVRLTNDAKARGANVDLPTVLNNWRRGLKANAMSRNDMPPEVKEALLKQISAGESLTDNIQTDELGVTDYAKEAELYSSASTSVKEQLAPKKVEEPINVGTPPAGGTPRKTVTPEEAQAAGKKALAMENDIRAIFGTRKNLEPYEQKNKDKMLAEVAALRETAASAGGTYEEANAATEMSKINLIRTKIQSVADKSEINYLKELQQELQSGGYIGFMDRLSQHAIGNTRLSNETQRTIEKDPISSTVPRKVIVQELSAVDERRQKLDDFVAGLRSIQDLGITEDGKDILPDRKLAMQKAIKERIDTLSKPREEAKKVTTENIREMAGAVAGKPVATTQETKPEQEFALTNQQNLSLGTTTTKVATSIESKRKDMMDFFTKKYGYVPASFEQSFKAIYPEANFKTMETPYGAFMYDGKEWKQIQMQQPKTMSNKEIAEEKAVTFGTPNAEGNIDFQELAPRSGVYVRGIFAGTPTEAFKFRGEMLETANARVAVNRLIEINDMVGESMPWNAKLWGEAKALLPQIKAGLRTDIIGVGTVSNYEQQLIEEVVADPTKFWSLESSDRAKLTEIMRRVNNRLMDKPAIYGLEVKVAGQSNAEIERNIRMGRAGKSKLELDFEARGNKKGVKLDWGLANKIPTALKE